MGGLRRCAVCSRSRLMNWSRSFLDVSVPAGTETQAALVPAFCRWRACPAVLAG